MKENSPSPLIFHLPQPDGSAVIFDAGKGEIGLAVVDVEREHADPGHWADRGNETTVSVSKAIGAFLPAIRGLGVDVTIIHTGGGEKELFNISARDANRLMQKHGNSGFTGTTLDADSKARGHKLLIFCGFNTSACVTDNINDARNLGYATCLFEDLSGNDEDANRKQRSIAAIHELHAGGTFIVSGAQALRQALDGIPVLLDRTLPPLSPHHHRDANRLLRPSNPAISLGR